MLNKFIQQIIFKLIFIVLITVTMAGEAISQTPVIKPAAWVVKFETYLPYTYDQFSNANPYTVRQYISLHRDDGTNLFVYENFATGLNNVEYFFNEDGKPGKIMAYYDLDSLVFGWSSNLDCGPGSLNYMGECEQGRYLMHDGHRFFLGSAGFADLQYPFMDTTIVNPATNCYLRIRVNSASDDNLNLPSSDYISIKVENPDNAYFWEYEVLDQNGNGTWAAVPSTVPQNSTALHVHGEALFGSNWMSYLNKTVLFRLRKVVSGQSFTSNILVYTHRLSSPRIVSITPVPNRCYGQDSASMDVKFSRPLLSGETVNVFLKDSATGADFSALNLSSANFNTQTNTYTWTKELIKGNYRMSLIGKYNGMATYTGSVDHFAKAVINDPPLLRLQTRQIPALCFDGNSGNVVIRARGGVGNYKYQLTDTTIFTQPWQNFSAPMLQGDGFYEYPHSGLIAKDYRIRMRDGNDCKILDSLGNERFVLQKVTQPSQPLQMPVYIVSPVTANNASDGSITIQLSGGTPFPAPETQQLHKKYEFEWRDSATNDLITNYSLDTNGVYRTKIQNLPAGTYRFIAWDRNYDPSSSSAQQGCRIDIHIRLKNPDPLLVDIASFAGITCQGASDGKLKAFATGGIPVSDSTRYNFTWYRLVNGSYVNLNINDSILSQQSAGTFYVEIRDKFNNLKTSSIFNFAEPAAITATAVSTPSSCYFTADGTMNVSVTGGTAPYDYEWSNGALTQSVAGVAGGTYYVVIKDANFCLATKQVNVTSPNKITTSVDITKVNCPNTASGAIELTAIGGTGNFTYLWNTGATTSSVNDIPAGQYWYRITDANGCFDTDTLKLENPDNYSVYAGADRKICVNQLISLSPIVSGTQEPISLKWITPTGVRDSSIIHTSLPGYYIVEAANTTGCYLLDTVNVLSQNATVNTNFTVSTQAFAGENTTLVNISPQLQDSVNWMFPSNMSYQLVNSSRAFCEVKIADTGVYNVGMIAYYSNGCIDELYKPINVVRSMGFPNLGSQAEAFLKQFSVLPNPTSGSFTVNLLFNAVTQARIRIVNVLTNVTLDTKLLNGAASYSQQYNISIQPAGTYIIIIETAKGNFIHKLNKL